MIIYRLLCQTPNRTAASVIIVYCPLYHTPQIHVKVNLSAACVSGIGPVTFELHLVEKRHEELLRSLRMSSTHREQDLNACQKTRCQYLVGAPATRRRCRHRCRCRRLSSLSSPRHRCRHHRCRHFSMPLSSPPSRCRCLIIVVVVVTVVFATCHCHYRHHHRSACVT